MAEGPAPRAEGPAPWPGPAIVVPDDARELDGDRRTWLREQRQARLLRLVTHSRSGRSRPLALYVTLAVALCATIAGLLTAALPHSRPLPRPLAGTSVPDGQVGGLLPALELDIHPGRFPARALRPAALVFVPARCGCTETLGTLARAAATVGVLAWIVVPAPVGSGQVAAGDDPAAAAAELVRAVGSGAARAAADPGGALRAAIRPSAVPAALVLTLVRADGVIDDVLIGPQLEQAVAEEGLDVRFAALSRVVPSAAHAATATPPA